VVRRNRERESVKSEAKRREIAAVKFHLDWLLARKLIVFFVYFTC